MEIEQSDTKGIGYRFNLNDNFATFSDSFYISGSVDRVSNSASGHHFSSTKMEVD